MADQQTAEQKAAAAAAEVEAKAKEEAAKVAEAAKGKMQEVFEYVAVHGDIHHPYTSAMFTIGKAVEHVKDTWIDAQLEGGKLKRWIESKV